MVAVVVSAALAFVGNQNRQRTEMAINRHFEMVARLNDLLTLVLNAETGLRGHLLTHQAEFLEPYTLAERTLPGQLASLHSFVEAEPGTEPRQQKRARLARIQETVEHEIALLDALRQIDVAGWQASGDTRLPQQFLQSKETMDTLRGQLRGMQDEEKQLLNQRLTEIRRVRRRDYLSISVALLLGLLTRGAAFWLFNRRVVRRIEQLTDNVRASLAGQVPPYPPSGHHDAIGELEQVVSTACHQELGRRTSG